LTNIYRNDHIPAIDSMTISIMRTTSACWKGLLGS